MNSANAFDWKTQFKYIKKNNSLFQIYKRGNTMAAKNKINKRNTFSNLKLDQIAFSRQENSSNSNGNIIFPKTTRAENNINIYSGIQHSMKKKNISSFIEKKKSDIFGTGNMKNKSKQGAAELKKSKRITNFTIGKYSRTFNKLPTTSALYANENFQY